MTAVPRPAGCRHWSGTTRTHCGATPTRRYLTGDRCTDHAPGAAR